MVLGDGGKVEIVVGDGVGGEDGGGRVVDCCGIMVVVCWYGRNGMVKIVMYEVWRSERRWWW